MRDDIHAIQIIAELINPAAGPTYSATRLAEKLTDYSITSEIYSTGEIYRRARSPVKTHSFPTDFRGVPAFGSMLHSLGMRRSIIKAGETANTIFHTHGLWQMPNVYPSVASRKTGAPFVLSPRGMLSPGALKFSAWKKRAFNALIQKRALETVSCFHATAPVELEDIRNAGLNAPVAIIPNGIDIPTLTSVKSRRRNVLYLGRVHPKKGIDRLLKAWEGVEAVNPDVLLRIVGPSENGHGEELKRLSEKLKLKNVRFEEPLFDAAKIRAFEEADLFVLPTLSENFGIVVSEALAASCPVICTFGAPWEGLRTHSCGWWIDHGPHLLRKTLNYALSRPREELAAMGRRGREWQEREFSWPKVSEDVLSVYEWLLGRRSRPEVVSLTRTE